MGVNFPPSMHRLFLFLALLAGGSPAARAQFDSPFGQASSSVANLVSENRSIAPGKSFSVALKLSHPEEWHSYYQNSGGVELPPSITWKLPTGFTAGPIQWPVPQVKDGFLGKSFVYSGEPVFVVDLTAPSSLKAGETVTLTADATWQICNTGCISEQKSFTFNLPVAAVTEADPTQAPLFAKARSNQAKVVSSLKTSASPAGQKVELRVSPVAAVSGTPTDFIPNEPFLQPASGGGSIKQDGDAWVITLERKTKDMLENDIPQGTSLSGILTGPVPVVIGTTSIGVVAAAVPPAAAAAHSPPSYFRVLFGMFVGGLILNLMPCVFPVIGLKIMGFVQQAGHDRRRVMLHGIIFALGVFVSFGVLAGALFAGGIANWGNQLQDPRVTFVTVLIMLLLGMNLFGVFEIGTSATGIGGNLAQKQGIAGTFFSGVLATLVATPCSGPFLGVAIGAAATLPAVPFFVAFAAMALGLSLPYLVLSAFPALVDRLPRPGPWMESFKQGMSFLLFAAAGVFLWVYSSQVFDRNDGQKGLWVMGGLSAIACAAWIYGRWNQPYRSGGVRLASRVIAIAFLASGVAVAWPWPVKQPVAGQQALKVEWQHWTTQEVDRLLANGQPVYVDFTAKWCLTCQLNKGRAYTPEVVKLMNDKKVVALKADKTNPDPAIDAKLKELGRTAIPVNALYLPGKKEPIITPELLSPQTLKDLFEQIP